MKTIKNFFLTGMIASTALLSGCFSSVENQDGSFMSPIPPAFEQATLSKRTSTYIDLLGLPKPDGRIITSVYNFRDQTGQYKPAPSSTFSTAVSQGATSMLIEALGDSGWFIPLEREGLQNLLTERKIIRAAQGDQKAQLPPMMSAKVMIEGGITAYETNTQTGGAGARFLGIGGAEQYRVDQVTVSLRAVNVISGQILNNVSTTKSILSKEITGGVFRYVDFKQLLELDSGMTTNEPANIAVRAAIEAAVIHLIVDGVRDNHWQLASSGDLANPIFKRYSGERPQVVQLADANIVDENAYKNMAKSKGVSPYRASIMNAPQAQPRALPNARDNRRWWNSYEAKKTIFPYQSSGIDRALPPLRPSADPRQLSRTQLRTISQNATEKRVRLDALKTVAQLDGSTNQGYEAQERKKSGLEQAAIHSAEERLKAIRQLQQEVEDEETLRKQQQERVLKQLQARWKEKGIQLLN